MLNKSYLYYHYSLIDHFDFSWFCSFIFCIEVLCGLLALYELLCLAVVRSL